MKVYVILLIIMQIIHFNAFETFTEGDSDSDDVILTIH